jgi:hydroxypyruvate isomerase
MLRFASNVSTMFREIPLLERFQAARKAGFVAVEMQYPYSISAAALRTSLNDADVQLVLMNAPPGDSTASERGLACLPGRTSDFRRSIDLALEYADAANCTKLHVLSGIPKVELNRNLTNEILVYNLDWAVAQCESAGVLMLLEALNSGDAPGYAIGTLKAAADLVNKVGHPSCRLQFDTYHCLAQGEDVLQAFDKFDPIIGHVQIADFPGRGEPGTGTVDWQVFFDRLESSSYRDYIGCEYIPLGTTEDGLRWMNAR